MPHLRAFRNRACSPRHIAMHIFRQNFVLCIPDPKIFVMSSLLSKYVSFDMHIAIMIYVGFFFQYLIEVQLGQK